MDRLVPTSLEQWTLLEYTDELGCDVRCTECKAEAPIAFYINHADDCIAAKLIKLSIDNLPADVKRTRRDMERHL